MRGRLGFITTAALLLAVASVTVAGASSPKSSAADAKAVEVIRLETRVLQQAELDLGETGPSQGDQQVFTDNVFSNGRKVGQASGVATITYFAENRTQVQLLITLSLPKGQISHHGVLTFAPAPQPTFVAITGGTGAYRTAHGQTRVEVNENGAVLTVHLIR
jgi:hypothetical protein